VGPKTAVLPCERFEDVFRALKSGAVGGAVVPIENTLAGSVHENYDHLVNFELPIVAETSVRIVHNLIVRKGVPFSRIKAGLFSSGGSQSMSGFLCKKSANRTNSLL
jgi:prephenate dehydratase